MSDLFGVSFEKKFLLLSNKTLLKNYNVMSFLDLTGARRSCLHTTRLNSS